MQLTERFDNALLFASSLHRQQLRKASGVPYLSHLLCVAGIVLEYGGSEDEAIAALLHDAIEDQGGEQARVLLLEKFGEQVTSIVQGVTDSDTVPKLPWQERKERFIATLATASRSVLLVTMADKMHNCACLLREYYQHGEDLWVNFRGGRQGTLWYYRAVLQAVLPSLNRFSDANLRALYMDCDRLVCSLERAVDDGKE